MDDKSNRTGISPWTVLCATLVLPALIFWVIEILSLAGAALPTGLSRVAAVPFDDILLTVCPLLVAGLFLAATERARNVSQRARLLGWAAVGVSLMMVVGRTLVSLKTLL